MWVTRARRRTPKRTVQVKPSLEGQIHGAFQTVPRHSLQMAAVRGDQRSLRQWWLRSLIGWESYNCNQTSMYRFNELEYVGSNQTFMTAARAGDLGLMEAFLLERGSSWEVQCKTLPWMVAVEMGHVSVLEALVNHCEGNYFHHLTQMLSEAVEQARCPAVQRFLGARVIKLEVRPTSIHLLPFLTKPYGLEAILQSGLKVADGIFRQPFLSAAVMKGNLKCVSLIIKYGANINARDKLKKTALHKAVENDQLEMAKLLCESGARVDLKDNAHYTALEKARTDEMRNLLLSYSEIQGETWSMRLRDRVPHHVPTFTEHLVVRVRGRGHGRSGRARGRSYGRGRSYARGHSYGRGHNHMRGRAGVESDSAPQNAFVALTFTPSLPALLSGGPLTSTSRHPIRQHL